MIPGAVTVGFLHPGEYKECFANSLQDLILNDLFGEQRIVSHPHGKMGKLTGSGQIAASRNLIARVVVDDTEAEWLFFIDSDMGFGKDTVERLIASADPESRPVVGGLAFAMKNDGYGDFGAVRYRCVPTLYRMWENDVGVGFVPALDYPRDQLVEVDATGCACILIHRSALEKVRARFGPTWFDHLKVPKGKHGRTEFSEDLSFCARLKACGIPLWVDTSVKTTHDKGGVFYDEATYELQRAFHQVAKKDLIDIVIPTYRRSDRLAAVAADAIGNTNRLQRVTFVVERDDPDSMRAIAAIDDPRVRCLVNVGRGCYAGAINTAVPVVDAAWMFTGADDIQFHPGWDDAAVTAAQATGAKVVGTNDLWNQAVLDGRHSTHSLVDMGYVRTVGATFDATPGVAMFEYDHNYPDTELVTAAKARGVFTPCLDSIVEHMHPLAGKAEVDDTYRKGLAEFDTDRAEFERRLAAFVEKVAA